MLHALVAPALYMASDAFAATLPIFLFAVGRRELQHVAGADNNVLQRNRTTSVVEFGPATPVMPQLASDQQFVYNPITPTGKGEVGAPITAETAGTEWSKAY